MMRRLIVSVAFVLGLMTLAAAQENSSPKPVLFEHGPFESRSTGTLRDVNSEGKAPFTCSGCIFYGGDTNCNDPNSQGFADENTVLVPETETLGAVTIPAGKQIVLTGLFFNTIADAGDFFDPHTGSWEIRKDVSEGNGGMQVAAGSNAMQVQEVGKTCGLAIFQSQDTVMLSKPQTLTSGTYWFNVTPQCTNSGDSNCDGQDFYAENTTQGTNGIRAKLQPLHEIYLNSAYFGYTYANWCDEALGQNSHQCAALSFGVIGH